MRQTLRELGRPRTSAGVVALQMHVGIHTGTFQFFLVGDSHRELLLAGPAVSETVAMEAGSDAGEILLSRAAAAAVPDQRARRREGRRSAPADGTSRLRTPASSRCPTLPVCRSKRAFRSRSATTSAATRSSPSTGRRPSRSCDSPAPTRLLVERGVAGLEEALDELVRTVQTAADEYHVSFLESDIDADAGRIVLVAGAPSSAGDDDERMLRTVRAIADAGLRLPLQIGVNRGRVFAGEVGAPFRRTYTILGETAAVAARLMARAEPGAILATQDVVERSRARFETTELEPFQVKGKEAPVVAHEVGAVTGERGVAPSPATEFVGRERELTVLGASLAPVRMGYGSLVELIGEAGMGKSRLIEELRRQNPDLEHLVDLVRGIRAVDALLPVSRAAAGAPRSASERKRGRARRNCCESVSHRSLPSSFRGSLYSRFRSTLSSSRRPRSMSSSRRSDGRGCTVSSRHS